MSVCSVCILYKLSDCGQFNLMRFDLIASNASRVRITQLVEAFAANWPLKTTSMINIDTQTGEFF